MPTNVDKYFTSAGLPQYLWEINQPVAELQQLMEQLLPDGPEKSAGMRKLLEARDCFLRARTDQEWANLQASLEQQVADTSGQ